MIGGVLGNGRATLKVPSSMEVCDMEMIKEMLIMKLKAVMVLWEMGKILLMILPTHSPRK